MGECGDEWEDLLDDLLTVGETWIEQERTAISAFDAELPITAYSVSRNLF